MAALNSPVAKENQTIKKHLFLQIAILVALLSWFFDSFMHYFVYGELEFEIIPSDFDELWMRSTIFLLLIAFGLFADYQSKKAIEKSRFYSRAESIARAKKQWELVVDTLPQLIILMDGNAIVTRVNRTVEAWGLGKVDKVDGLHISDFLKGLNDKAGDAWTSDWPYIWQQIKVQDTLVRKIEKEPDGKVFQYNLRKISDYDINKDQCYAVLIIEDITARQSVEKSLKEHAQELEKNINERTLQLKQTNEQLEFELQVQKRAKKELKESQQCRIGLLHELFTAQESERKRIAYELHDSIGQSLGATKFKIEELLISKQNGVVKIEHSQFNDIVEKIKNVMDDVRHIAMNLRPSMIDDLGIIVTLKWFFREFESTYTEIKVEQLLNVEESDIAEERKIVIFRIVQEAMNNIVKHANATNIIVELSYADSCLKLCISDNGCGFDANLLCNKPMNNLNHEPKAQVCCLGLSSMRERAESTHGDFSIESSHGDGTSVRVSWEAQQTPLVTIA